MMQQSLIILQDFWSAWALFLLPTNAIYLEVCGFGMNDRAMYLPILWMYHVCSRGWG